MRPEQLRYRVAILLLLCGCVFPQTVMHSMYYVLQTAIAKAPNCTVAHVTNSSYDCCADCLGIGDDNYNLAFSVYYISCVFSVLLISPLVDRQSGSWLIIVFCVTSVTAFALIALASTIRGSQLMLPLIYAGSFMFGGAIFLTMSARDRIVSVWFKDKELHLAFGISGSVIRLSSLPSFLLAELVRERVGLQLTLWLCVLVGCVSIASSVAVAVMDARGLKKLGRSDEMREERKEVRMFDIVFAGSEFWLLALAFGIGNGLCFVLLENSVELIHEKFSFSKQHAAMIAGFHEYFAIVCYPITGLIIDKAGHPGYFLLFSGLLFSSAQLLLMISNLHPMISLSMIGAVQSFQTTAGVASVALVVRRSLLASGSAICRALEGVVDIFSHAAIAALLGHGHNLTPLSKITRWRRALGFMLGISLVSLAVTVVLNIVSKVKGGAMTSAHKEKAQDNYEQIKEADEAVLTNKAEAEGTDSHLLSK